MKALLIVKPNFGPDWKDYRYLFDEAGIEYEVTTNLDDDDIAQRSQDKDVILTAFKHPFSRDLIMKLGDSVKGIVQDSIGYDMIDVEAATERGMIVTNVPLYSIQEVSVHTIAMVLNLLKKVSLYNTFVKSGKWKGSPVTAGYPIHRVSTLTMGFFGFGRIGRITASYAKPFNMKLIAYDPFLPDSVFEENGVERVTEDELLSRSDVISMHVPLFPETKFIINKEAVSKMKDGVLLVNTGRGLLVEEQALIDGLQSGKIAGAGLDVFNKEPFNDLDNPLLKMDNVITTPHAAYESIEAMQDLQRMAVEYAIEIAKGEMPATAVNKKQLGA